MDILEKRPVCWLQRVDDCVWLVYSPDRKGQHPPVNLKDFNGILQAYGYAGFALL